MLGIAVLLSRRRKHRFLVIRCRRNVARTTRVMLLADGPKGRQEQLYVGGGEAARVMHRYRLQ